MIWCHLVVMVGSNLNIVGDNSESRGSRIASVIPEMSQLVGQIQRFALENTENQRLTLHFSLFLKQVHYIPFLHLHDLGLHAKIPIPTPRIEL